MRPHLHPFHELIVLMRGKMRVESANLRIEAIAGDALLYPARIIHAEWSDATAPVESLFFSFHAKSLKSRSVVRIQDSEGRIRQMVRWLDEDKYSSVPYIQEERRILFQAIVLEFVRNAQPRDQPTVLSTRQYIQDHIAEPLALEILARQARLSKYYFARTYKTWTGRTPMEDVRRIRANYARELILSTSLPLKDIAPRTGLGNEYAMSRIFRRYFNMPPGEWRRHRSARS